MTGSDTLRSVIVEKYSVITLKLNMKLDNPDNY